MVDAADFRCPAGFTLLEMLVALAVVGLLAVGLANGEQIGFRLWNAESRRIGQTAELDAAARALRRLLMDIPVQPAGERNGSSRSAVLAGETERFTFVGDLPTGFGATRRADITLDFHQGRLRLLWRQRRHEATAGAPATGFTDVVGGIAHLEFAYWGRSSEDQPAGWHAQWEGPQVPERIRLRLVFPRGDGRRWPDLVVAPRLSGLSPAAGNPL